MKEENEKTKKKNIQIKKQNRKNLCRKIFDKASIRKNLCRKIHFFGAPIRKHLCRILLYPHYFMALRYTEQFRLVWYGLIGTVDLFLIPGDTTMIGA